MRPDGTFNTKAPQLQPQLLHSSWHSPVPYLFGGLAAMLGLIAFALLILACSYWNLSSNGLDGEREDHDGGEGKPLESIKVCRELDEKIVVIMAGDHKPTFLATPVSRKASSFNDRKEEATNRGDDGSEKKHKDDETHHLRRHHQEQQQAQGGENQ